jgi:hypothetical protein
MSKYSYRIIFVFGQEHTIECDFSPTMFADMLATRQFLFIDGYIFPTAMIECVEVTEL